MLLRVALLLPIVAVSVPAVAAQTIEPPPAAISADVSRGGLVLRTWDTVWAAPHGAPLARVDALSGSEVLAAIATPSGVVASNASQLAFVPWSELAAEPRRAEAFDVRWIASDGERVLALDAERRAWRLGAHGEWTSTETNLGAGVVTELAGAHGRWLAAVLEPDTAPPVEPEQDAGELGYVEGEADFGGLGYGGQEPAPSGHPALWWSNDGVGWTRGALPADVAAEWVPIDRLAGGRGAWLASLSGGKVLASSDGATWRALAPPPLRNPFAAPDVEVAAGMLCVLDVQFGQPLWLHSSSDGVAWTTREFPRTVVLEALRALDERLVAVGRRTRGQPRGVFDLETFATPWTPDLGPEPLPAGASVRLLTLAQPIVELRACGERLYALTQSGFVHAVGETELVPGPFGDGWLAGKALDFVVREKETAIVGDGKLVLYPRSGGQPLAHLPMNPSHGLRKLIGGEDPMLALGPDDVLANGKLEDVWASVGATGPAGTVWHDGARDASGRTVVVGRGPDGRASALGGASFYGMTRARIPDVRGVPRAVEFGAGRFVAVGERGLVLASEDGVAWTALELSGEPDFVELAFGANQWGALASDGRLFLSSDARAWRVATGGDVRFEHLTATTKELFALDASGVLLVWGAAANALDARAPLGVRAIGFDDCTERVTTLVDTPLGRATPIHGLVHDGSAFYGVDARGLFTSSDGRTFVQTTHGPSGRLDGIAVQAGRVWTWAREVTEHTTVRLHGPNGSIIEGRALELPAIRTSASDGTRVAFASCSQRYTFGATLVAWTDDLGRTWSQAQVPVYQEGAATLAYGDGLWLVAGASEPRSSAATVVAVSRDLVAWEVRPLGESLAAPTDLGFVAGKFVAAAPGVGGKSLELATSSDGVNWEERRLTGFGAASLRVTSDRLYLHDGEHLIASVDGVDWRRVGALGGFTSDWMLEHAGVLFVGGRTAPTVPSIGASPKLVRMPAPGALELANAEIEPWSVAPRFAARLSTLESSLRHARYVLQRARIAAEFVASTRAPTSEQVAKLADALLSFDRSPQFLFIAMATTSDALMVALRERLKPEELAAFSAYAKDIEGAAWIVHQPVAAGPLCELYAEAREYPGAKFSFPSLLWEHHSRGNAAAAYDIGIAYEHGLGVPKSAQKRDEYFGYARSRITASTPESEIATLGSVFASTNLALSALRAEKLTTAYAWLRHAAAATGMEASYELARAILFDADFRAGSIAEAYTWLGEASKRGHAESMNLLALALRNGLGAPEDSELSRKWLEAGARHGSQAAAENLKGLIEWEESLKAMTETFQEAAELDAAIFERVNDAMGEYADSMKAALEDTAAAANPKYPPGTMLGTHDEAGFTPRVYVVFARDDGSYRVRVRDVRELVSGVGEARVKREVAVWRLQLWPGARLDALQRAPTAWEPCPTCNGRILIPATDEPGAEERPCSACAELGYRAKP
ncbi:MAG: sel1 repeat family protein [Planctomycetes bacterium]|nr:sel1 repeat family protein [Planctomycetota bacterium]